MRNGNPNKAPFPLVPVDRTLPEQVERDKRATAILERLAKAREEEEIRGKEYSLIHPHSNANNQSSGNKPFYCRDYQSRPFQNSVLVSADKTPTEPTTWLIPSWIPEGELTLIVGTPNSGKNTIAMAIAAAFSQGVDFTLWQGTAPTRSGDTIMSSTEEKFAGTSKLKFMAAGGNTKCLINLNRIPASSTTIANYTRRCNFSEEDYAIVRNEAKGIKNLSIMILDPVSQVISGNSGNNAKDREAYERLAQFTDELKFAAVGIGHTPKTTKGKEIYARIADSRAAGQVARSIIMVTKIKGGPLADGATHIMVLAKAFGKPVNYGVLYSIVTCVVTDEKGQDFETSKVVWHGINPGTPEENLALAESGEMVVGKITPLDVAVNWLKEFLSKGSVWSQEVERQAK